MNKIKQISLFLFLCFTHFMWSNDPGWNSYKQNVLKIQTSIPGWCPKEKAEKLMDFIYETAPLQCVEIGALAGATTFPMVCTLNYLGKGVLYAIDAYDNAASIEGLEPGDPNLEWLPNLGINMEEMHHILLTWVSDLQLKPFCAPVRLRSDQAVALFADESIDLLYLDGNISAPGSLQDAMLYFPKVKSGGYIWINLAQLQTKNQAIAFLMRNCEWIREDSSCFECILFKKP